MTASTTQRFCQDFASVFASAYHLLGTLRLSHVLHVGGASFTVRKQVRLECTFLKIHKNPQIMYKL